MRGSSESRPSLELRSAKKRLESKKKAHLMKRIVAHVIFFCALCCAQTERGKHFGDTRDRSAKNMI